MPKAYFIGGAPRVGKTTLSLKAVQARPMLASSTDAIRHMLREIIPEYEAPELFAMESKESTDNSASAPSVVDYGKVIKNQREECLIVWKSVVSFVESHLEDGFDVLIEGLAVLPEFTSALKFEHSAIFIGNVSDAHIQTTLDSALKNPHDWMRGHDPETARSFCVFNQLFSQYIESECGKYGQQYIEIDDNNFESSLDTALNILLKD